MVRVVGEHDLAAEVVDRVARADDDLPVALPAGDREPVADAGLVQALVVQPAHLAVERLDRLQVDGEQALAVEEALPLDRAGGVDEGHAGSPVRVGGEARGAVHLDAGPDQDRRRRSAPARPGPGCRRPGSAGR